MEETLAVILGGGRGTRLYPLTRHRSKPAVPFGGMYRLIDIPISNCLNSGVNRIFVITQFNSESLNTHIALTYKFDAFRLGFVTILAAEQTPDHTDWFQGTADAVRKNLRHFNPTKSRDVLILSGDHIYRMDYRVMASLHRRQRADITIAALPVQAEDAMRYGILKINSEGRVVEFCEKPKSIEQIMDWGLPPGLFGGESVVGKGPIFMASMGIYMIKKNALGEILKDETSSDFGRDVIPKAIPTHRVFAYPFYGYWEDIGTIRTYFEANLSLTDPNPKFELYDPMLRIFSRPRFLPGSRLDDVRINRALVAGGCRIKQTQIERSVIGTRSIVKAGVKIADSVIVGADYFETPEILEENREKSRPDIGIGGDTTIRKAIIDKNARIGYGVTIDPGEGFPDMDGANWAVRDGIVVIEKDAVVPDGSVIPEK